MNRFESISRKWIREFVIRNKFCPFAGKVYDAGQILFTLEEAPKTKDLLIAFWNSIHQLEMNTQYNNAFLITPALDNNWDEFLEFLDRSKFLLKKTKKDQNWQLVAFHPGFRFDGEDETAPGNYINRSPHAMIHILSVEQVSQAIENDPEIEKIPEKNRKFLSELGSPELRTMLDTLIKESKKQA